MSSDNGCVVTEVNYNIPNFRLIKVLHNNTVRKSVALLGTFPILSETDEAVLILEKSAFTESDVKNSEEEDSTYFSEKTKVALDFVNNIYGSFQCIPQPELNKVKATVIYPATEKHIQKYIIHNKYVVNETPALYENITLPYLKSNQFSLDWVYNILEHKQETDRIVCEDSDPETGFVLVPDLKWDGVTLETLYLLAIVHKRDIKSLRDLNRSHLPLLKNIREKCLQPISEKYGLAPSQIRAYFHYQPSFYHLHVHFNPIGSDAPGIWCEKSHLLDTVINNIELMGDYYQRATLPFVVYEGNKLHELYEEEMSPRTIQKLCSQTSSEESQKEEKKEEV